MRYTFGFLLIMLHLAGVSQEAVITDQLRQQEQAWNRGDIPAFMSYYWNNDSLQFVGGRGVTYGWQKVLDNYVKTYPDKTAMGELSFDLYQLLSLSDEYVYVVGRWSLKKEKPAGGYFTLLWRKIGGRWLIVSDHTS